MNERSRAPSMRPPQTGTVRDRIGISEGLQNGGRRLIRFPAGHFGEVTDNGTFKEEQALHWPCQMRDNFSLVVLPLLLHLVPLLATAISWRLERRASLALSKARRVLFYAGVLLSPLSLLLTASCWVDAYPLVQHADGSSSIPGLELAWNAAFITGITTSVLALAGKGKSRIALAVSGLLTLALAYGTLLQNGI